ncbi:MAG TPA: ATP-binding protein [Archangium sp.]|uniref:sensor histidine kinase n=1 Tax=Archangium sp. TaxID=1872627 RepID=UPI002E353FFD|nr:ATP-binding protein [Archangium sp.]HEX5748374.1 ATP-binding protein [Archangium sp.]
MAPGPQAPLPRHRSLLRSPLYLRMVASITAVLLIPAIITSLYNVQRSAQAHLEASHPQLLQATEAKATAVEALLLRSISDVLLLGQAPPMRRYAQALATAPASPPQDVLELFQTVLRRSGGLYDGITLLDRTGQEQVAVLLDGKRLQVVPKQALRSRAHEAFFSGAMSLGGISGQLAPVYLSPVELEQSPEGHRPALHYALQVLALDGSAAGVLVVSAPLQPLLRPLRPDEPEDRVYLVDASGNYLASPEPRHLHGDMTGPGPTLRTERPRDAKELLGRPGGTLLDTAERPGYLQAFARIRPAGQGTIQWTVLYERPLSTLLASEREISRVILATTAGSLLLALLVALFFTRGLVGPIRQLATAADALSQGQWQTPLPSSRRRDELGELTESFAKMGHQLQSAWLDQQRHVEALRQAHDELEQRVSERTRELREAHHQLMEAARVAGREEIATTVLHNVGNVLSSVKVSTQLLEERFRRSRLHNLFKALELLRGHQQELARYLTEDPQGRLLPAYLSSVGGVLAEEHAQHQKELEGLRKNLDHIGNIISVQQSLAARPSQLLEEFDVCDAADDALHIQLRQSSQIEVVRDYAQVPKVLTDRHKLLQIFVNLVSNARHALMAAPISQRRLVVRIRALDESIQVEVSDNGIGISEVNMRQIFQYGFTARKDGHGFGLHGCALLAQSMGGSLRARSDGPSQGAAFTLELPWKPGSPARPAPDEANGHAHP